MERDVLVSIRHPFLVNIDSSFQTDKKVYLLLEYCPGGELFRVLSKQQKFTEGTYICTDSGPASTLRRFYWLYSTSTPKTSSTATLNPKIS